jgi:multidrug efflux pump subunit AcrB
MVKFLIHRPIAVLVTTFSLVVLGIVFFRLLPVSLLPDLAVPEISIQVSYQASSAKELNQTVTKPLINQLLQVNHLQDITAESRDGYVLLKLRFDFGSHIDLAYIETNEKIDAIIGTLPRDMARPIVIKAGASDLPVFNINVWSVQDANFLELSEFCENVLKRRLEQSKQVALVDITGLSKAQVSVIPKKEVLQRLGITNSDLASLIQDNNIDLGNFVVKDGQYQYNIRFSSVLKTVSDIEQIYLRKSSRIFQLKDLAVVKIEEQFLPGQYIYNGQRAICMAIIKQADSQLLNLEKELQSQLNQYKKDYPNLSFSVSQDQTELLKLSINNLIGNILLGGFCTIVMIFFFMNDLKKPVLIGLIMPVSLVITFLCFYLFHISINIVSLAGIVLGVGEIIDSAIIVIENIEDKRETGSDLENACIDGTQEVIVPLFTSILTNASVFLPLIFLSGLAGALFLDQAIAVSVSLAISLLCSYTLVPVLYFNFYKKQSYFDTKNTYIANKIEQLYNWFFELVFDYKKSFFIFFILILLAVIPLFTYTPKQGMPKISHTELEAKIDWNEPISVEENKKRTTSIIFELRNKPIYSSIYIGQQQFILNNNLNQTQNESQINIKVSSQKEYEYASLSIRKSLTSKYPKANLEINPTKNIFELLFNTNLASLILKIKSSLTSEVPNATTIGEIYDLLIQNKAITDAPPIQNRLFITIDNEKLLLYNVDYQQVYQLLKTIFNENVTGNLKAENKYIPIQITNASEKTNEELNTAMVKTKDGNQISLNQLIRINTDTDHKTYFQGKEGNYYPFNFYYQNVSVLKTKISRLLKNHTNIEFSFSGAFENNSKLINEIFMILLVAIGLLYFILTAQFESFAQPLVVMLTILFGLTGAIFFLWISDSSINIMSLTGMIVLIGILDNDSILKIDTMNKSKKTMDLKEAIKSAGKKRLKSQIMTFLTTILGLLPILFSTGLGSELQKPLALSIIGGMCFGIIISWSFIPLVYYWLNKSVKNFTA